VGFFSFLSGSTKAVETINTLATGAVAAIDKIVFTDEEKADGIREVVNIVIERVKLASGESSVRSITRRIIAIMFCGAFLSLLLGSGAVYPWFKDWALHLYNLSTTLKNPIIAIIIFYFGSYGIGYLMDKRKKEE